MELKWIEDFLSLAKTRSFSRTAEERGVTQPALSRRIRALESWVGAELVDRSTYPARVTPAGKLFQEQATDFLRQMLDTRAMLRGQDSRGQSSLKIAAGHTLALNFLPRWLLEMQRQGRAINARVLAANVHDAVLSLVEGGCDLLLCYHHPELPVLLDPERYHHRVVGTERVIPVSVPARNGRAAHALPGSKQRPVDWLAYTGTSYFGRCVELLLKNAGRTVYLDRCQESDMAELLKNLALQGAGLAWVPVSSVARELEAGKLVAAGDESWSMRLEVRLYRAADNRHPALLRLWDAVLAE